MDPVIGIAILLAAALVGGMIAHRLNQPVILGYLVVGVAVGPYALSLVDDLELIEAAATMGVALLMLTLGLEISIGQLKQVGKVGLWGGIIQILVTFALGLLAGFLLFKWPLVQAFLFGLVISLSSTMVCLKVLMERGELDSVHGQIMISILILQDISVVLIAVLIHLLGGSVENLPLTLASTAGAIALSVGIAIVSGLWVLPWLMGRVGGIRSRELFLLIVLVLGLGTALATQIFGLSVIFGAFIVGLVLRETRFAHQALAEITPLRDIFATLFFVSLGMLLSPRFVLENWGAIAATVALIFLIKTLVVFGVVYFFGYSRRIAVFTSVGLFQVGEFSFILAQTGVNEGIITDQFYSLVLASAIVSMILTPLLMDLVSWLYPRLTQALAGGEIIIEDAETLPSAKPAQAVGSVVIAGYGRVGQNIAKGLQDARVPFTVIEIDPERIFDLRCEQVSCVYGDASNIHVLSRVDLAKAKVLVVTFPDPQAVVTTVTTALKKNPKLKIVARVHRARDAELLKSLGVTELVSPEYVASLEFLDRVLSLSGWKEAKIEHTLDEVRQDKEIAEFSSEEEV